MACFVWGVLMIWDSCYGLNFTYGMVSEDPNSIFLSIKDIFSTFKNSNLRRANFSGLYDLTHSKIDEGTMAEIKQIFARSENEEYMQG